MVGRMSWVAAAVSAVSLSALALVLASIPASVSYAEPAGATPGSSRGAAAVIAAGGLHACALLENGSVKCWGRNDLGQLGYGDVKQRGDDPGEMGGFLPAIDLGAGRIATAITAARAPQLCAPRRRHRQMLGRQHLRAAGIRRQGVSGRRSQRDGRLPPSDRPRRRTLRDRDHLRRPPFVRAARRRHCQVLG